MLPFKTKRLLLRELKNSDLEELYALLSNKEVMRFSVNGPYTLPKAKEWLLTSIDAYKSAALGMLAIVEIKQNRLIGIAGLMRLESYTYANEIGYRLLPEFQNKDYGSEAAMAIRDMATSLHINEFCAFISEENIASKKVAEKIGMKYLKNDNYKGFPVLVYVYKLEENID